MLQLKIAVQLGTLHQPLRNALDSAANLGVDAVELDLRNDLRIDELSRTAVRQILKLLDDRRLRISSVRFATRRGYHEVEGLDRRVEATKLAMQKAFELGAPIVCNPIASVPAPDTPEGSLLSQVLFDLSRHASKTGASLALSTAVTGEELKDLLTEARPGLVLELDGAGVLMAGGKPEQVAADFGDRVVQVRMRDAVRDLSRKGGVEVQVGRGSVDFPEILGKLEERQFQGYLLLGRDEPEDPAPGRQLLETGEGVEYLRNLWR